MTSATPFTKFIDSHFSDTNINEAYKYVRAIKSLRPGSVHIPVVEHRFPVVEFLESKAVELQSDADQTVYLYSLRGPEKTSTREALCGVHKFTYNGTAFTAFQIEIPATEQHGPTSMFWDFVYDPPASAQPQDAEGSKLIEEIHEWGNVSKEDAIWVYDNGCWMQDTELYQAIKSSNWDTLVLDDKFIQGLKRDTNTFFSSEKIYKSLGITWKRGILLLGPPGNGKTETIKSLLNDTSQAALYVKSFSSMAGPEYGIRNIFDHARTHAPCILILEDLDSMVTPMVRSFFLNELDGLAQNQGILTIATTNHPERIDDAILNRPSRFDVKYNFKLPEKELRKKFATKWVKKLRGFESDPDIGTLFERADDTEIADEIAEKTDGWSFAFLKELFVSFLLRFAHDSSLSAQKLVPKDIEKLLFDQIEQLGLQILKSVDESEQFASSPTGSVNIFGPPMMPQRGVRRYRMN